MAGRRGSQAAYEEDGEKSHGRRAGRRLMVRQGKGGQQSLDRSNWILLPELLISASMLFASLPTTNFSFFSFLVPFLVPSFLPHQPHPPLVLPSLTSAISALLFSVTVPCLLVFRMAAACLSLLVRRFVSLRKVK